jgi:hypothetical protein
MEAVSSSLQVKTIFQTYTVSAKPSIVFITQIQRYTINLFIVLHYVFKAKKQFEITKGHMR